MNEKKERIIAIIAEAAGTAPDQIQEDTPLDEIPGWSSLAHLMVLSTLMEELQIDIPIEKALTITSVADFLAYTD
jgi:acyl carrier protein